MVSTNIGKNNVSQSIGTFVFRLLDPFFKTLDEGAQSVVSAVHVPDKYAGFDPMKAVLLVKQYGSEFKMRREFIDATLEELNLESL
ncbi:MAG: hypothetical protein U5K84_14500 [Alkalibacterium sp.]|nr:hypothetical protein [Alkalibacterium sp.]